MCDQRERLIEFVYDECDVGERQLIERHLDECDTCRSEIKGLRDVRQDLLAWEVPAHESVWRPFAPARQTPWWREVPAWALAAAASLVFLLGAAGGVVTHAFISPDEPAVVASASTAALPSTVYTAATGAGFDARAQSAMEQRILELMRGELNQRVRLASARGVQSGHAEALTQQIGNLAGEDEAQMRIVRALVEDLVGLRNDMVAIKSSTDAQIAVLASKVDGGGGSR